MKLYASWISSHSHHFSEKKKLFCLNFFLIKTNEENFCFWKQWNADRWFISCWFWHQPFVLFRVIKVEQNTFCICKQRKLRCPRLTIFSPFSFTFSLFYMVRVSSLHSSRIFPFHFMFVYLFLFFVLVKNTISHIKWSIKVNKHMFHKFSS